MNHNAKNPLIALEALRVACYDAMHAIENELLAEIVDANHAPFDKSISESLDQLGEWAEGMAENYKAAVNRGALDSSEYPWSVDDLRPSAVILAAKMLRLTGDAHTAADHVSRYMTLNGHDMNINAIWVHLVIIEAEQTPLVKNKLKLT